MSETPAKSFVIAMKDFFGLQPGQSAAGFMAEIKNLNDAEKAFFRADLIAQGVAIKDAA
jgi:hypothetical protein